MKLSDFVFEYLEEKGVKDVFLLPGGGNMHLVDSLGKNKSINAVGCLHEQAVAIAADGYAQAKNDYGVALVTTGPGGTNTITSVAGAWVESVPLVIISGQVKTADIKPHKEMRMLGFQEIDIVSIVKDITKYSVTITDPLTIGYHLSKALDIAKSGRPGPVWIDIPLDIQATEIEKENLIKFESDVDFFDSNLLESNVIQSIEILLKSKRPVILAGNGIRLSNSQELFIEIAKSLNIPVLSTWKAMDIFDENDAIFFGRPGTVAQRGANFIQQNSDCIISLGCRLDFGQIGYAQETFAREAKKIIVDIDSNEFKKFRFPIDIKVEANVSNFLTIFSEKIKDFEFPKWEEWRSICLNWKSKYSIMKQDFGDSEYTSTYALVDEISTQLNSKDVVVPCSSGSGADITSQTFRVKKGQRVLNSPGLGSMGYGVPQSIGACVAFGKNRTICINGDGGFQLNIQELETIYRLKLPIKFFYLNNQGYLSIKNTQINYFQSRLVVTDSSSGLTLPDIQKIAKAYNIRSNKIVNNSGLQVGVMEALESDGPFICEVMINPEEQVTPKVKTVLGNNGKLISKPLEDLFPFLERFEFLENMIVKPLDE